MKRMDNAPPDWDNYWTTCEHCGRRYHESEGGCDCRDDDNITPIEDLDDELDRVDLMIRKRKRGYPNE